MPQDEFDLAALEEGQDSAEARAVAPLRVSPSVAAAEAVAPARAVPDSAGSPLEPAAVDPQGAVERSAEAVAPTEEPAPRELRSLSVAKGAPTPTPFVFLGPPPVRNPEGLSMAEVGDRVRRGLVNRDDSKQRRDRDVIRENALTYFNMVLFSLILVLFILAIVDQEAGHAQDAFFVGIVVAANITIGTWQELRATHTLRALQALAAPRAMVIRDGAPTEILSSEVVQGDLVRVGTGDQIVADGRVVAESAEIDESLLTGESVSVRKDPGEPVLSGSFCTAGSLEYVAERVGKEAYAQQLTADARQLVRRATPLQIRFKRIVRILLIATAALGALLLVSAAVADDDLADAIKNTTATISSIVPEGLLLGMTVAFAVGAVRLSRHGAIVQDINAVEAMNYLDVVCLDKTGTITANELSLDETIWGSEDATTVEADRGWLGAFAVAGANESGTGAALAAGLGAESNGAQAVARVPFNSERRWSALTLELRGTQRHFVLGAPETVLPYADDHGRLLRRYEDAAAIGLRGVIFAEVAALPETDAGLDAVQALALITVADVLRDEVAEAFALMDEIGIEPKIISGDNPATVAALVRQLGIELPGGHISGAELDTMTETQFHEAVEQNSVFGRIAPEQKARIVMALRNNKHFVAMVGDGANDVRALRAADVAVAMESGAQTARAVAGIVLLNDSFSAFVYGTAEAQAVLGNSAQLSKLFITKSFYAFLIIVAADMLQLDFPFLPRHGSLTSLFTLGLPTMFIALTKPPPRAGADWTNTVLRFAVPAAFALAAATVAVHLLTQGFLDRAIEDSRTLVSLTIGIVGIYFMVLVIGFDGITREMRGRELLRPATTTFFGFALVGLFVLTIYTPVIRDFFDFVAVGADEWGIVIPAVITAMVGQYVLSRKWREILGWIVKQPEAEELERGRAV